MSTFLEWQHRKSLGSVSGSLRKDDQFLPLLPRPASHIIDVLVARLALPSREDIDELEVSQLRTEK